MRSQVGYVQVVVPPDIVVEESSSDLITTENSNVTLRCKAKGEFFLVMFFFEKKLFTLMNYSQLILSLFYR